MFNLIAGPCVLESESLAMNIAEKMTKICEKLKIAYTFKGSFDKANRTSFYSERGPGIDEGLRILERIKENFNIPVLTDIHEPFHADIVAEIVDIIQIPAFLCRQTDLLVAAGNTQKKINIKKAQFLAPWDMENVVKKVEITGNKQITLCERGTSFGYNNLVVDMTGLVVMKKLGYPVIFDVTHSVQKPGGNGDSSGGCKEFVEYLAKAAIAVGVDGLFLETHPYPDEALSDGPNMVKLNDMESLLEKILKIYEAVNNE